jgi:NAD+ synthase
MLSNPEQTKNEIVAWIREYFEHNGPSCAAVVGVSGGKDSSVTAALLAEALGKDRVIGVLMPNGVQSDISDSQQLVDFLQIPHMTVNIKDGFDGLSASINASLAEAGIEGASELSRDSIINLPPRLRMSTLYAIGQALPCGARVANTCNRSEDYIGYSTKYGDAAGDVSLLQDFTVTEVLQIGEYLGLPNELVHKTPSDGLSGMSDEDKLGFKYAQLDEYISDSNADIPADVRESIDRKHVANLHKLQLMPAYKRH